MLVGARKRKGLCGRGEEEKEGGGGQDHHDTGVPPSTTDPSAKEGDWGREGRAKVGHLKHNV
jgi:hypothetical protein